jgi:hypothetical protein
VFKENLCHVLTGEETDKYNSVLTIRDEDIDIVKQSDVYRHLFAEVQKSTSILKDKTIRNMFIYRYEGDPDNDPCAMYYMGIDIIADKFVDRYGSPI